MSEETKVVMIKTENGPARLNESDFNPDIHELHEEGKFDKKAARKAIEAKYTVQKDGEGKDTVWFIADGDGVEVDNLKENEFKSKADAQKQLVVMIDAELEAASK